MSLWRLTRLTEHVVSYFALDPIWFAATHRSCVKVTCLSLRIRYSIGIRGRSKDHLTIIPEPCENFALRLQHKARAGPAVRMKCHLALSPANRETLAA